jgi:hypothetical protein
MAQEIIQRKYPIELEEEFGNGLETIFGSEEEQKNKIDLKSIASSAKLIKQLIDKLPNEGVLDVYEEFGYNARPTFLQVAIKVLQMLKESGIFEIYKLPKLGNRLNRVGGTETEWLNLYLRYPVQRSVKVWHILRDILIEWDDNLNDPAYVRVLTDGTMNVNDKQHGNFGRLIMGAEKVFVEGLASNELSMDSNMYASRNIQNLESSWENNVNVRVTRAKDFLKEGTPVKEGDQKYLDFYNLLESLGCKFQESGLPKKAKVCQNGKKLYDDLDQYGEDIFKRAIKLNTAIWPHGELAREFVWGVCEFLKQMSESGFTDAQMRDITTYIEKSMKATYPDNTKKQNRATGAGTLWGDVLAYLNTLVTKGENKDWRVSLARNYVIAAGIRDLILNWNAYQKNNSNITPVKLKLPMIEFEDADVEVKIGFYHDGDRGSTKKPKKPYHRADEVKFDHTEIEFEDADNESEAVE